MKRILVILIGILTLVTSSCSDSSKIQYLPFRTSDTGKWGLISTNGKVLVESEFKNCPSPVINGCFYIENSKGLYEFHKADKKLTQIGALYKSVGIFSEGLAPAVEPNKWITYIDTEGNTIIDLKKLKNKTVLSANCFHNGLALVRFEDGYSSYINKKGELAFEGDFNYAEDFSDEGFAIVYKEREWSLIDTSGKEILTKKFEKCTPVAQLRHYVIVKDYSKDVYWVLDHSGDQIGTKFSAEKIKFCYDDRFVFSDGDGFGLRDAKDILIRPKYDDLVCDDRNNILAYIDDECYIINDEGEKINNSEIYGACLFDNMDGNNLIVNDGSSWLFSDNKGKVKGNAVAMEEISDKQNETVTTDYLDIDEFVSKLKIEDGKLYGMEVGELYTTAIKKLSPQITPAYFYNNWGTEFIHDISITNDIDVRYLAQSDWMPIYDMGSESNSFWNPDATLKTAVVGIFLNGRLANKRNSLIKGIENKLLKFSHKKNIREKLRFYESDKYGYVINSEESDLIHLAICKK